ncbi:hypothetical protein H9636_04530 [Ureibacillus sp. Re31]|uniref:Uncharacterized protein n=1 Tax=Ureibacillus galli TaxID=2762222 RepID=A0ABR8X9D1_9BACL|nr:hypothetical protein [Ureibacillus galli]MBD8025920.1 hypothetical protein [Ureibacillus galli]
MRKRLNIIISLICIVLFVVACTDNGDDTPVEAKENVNKVKNSSSSKIDSLLREV